MAQSTDYLLSSAVECERLERQADLHGRARVLEHINLKPGMRFLDAGSGSGWVSRLVAATCPDAEVAGVDLNPQYVDYARARAEADGLRNLTYEQGDLQSLRFPDQSFDVVWSQFVLYFLPDPQSALNGFRRVTRSGGEVITALHQHSGWAYPPTAVQKKMDRVAEAITSGWRCEILPHMYRLAGLERTDIQIQVDRVFSTIDGPIDADHLRNVEEVLKGPVERIAGIFGAPEEAKAFWEEWVAYRSEADTTYISTYWVAKGTVPVR